jgi:hypothetical protein
MAAMSDTARNRLPFRVERAAGSTLIEQVAAGVRQAILTGRYRAGELAHGDWRFGRRPGGSPWIVVTLFDSHTRSCEYIAASSVTVRMIGHAWEMGRILDRSVCLFRDDVPSEDENGVMCGGSAGGPYTFCRPEKTSGIFNRRS